MEENNKSFIRRFFGFLTAVIVGGAIGSILGLTLAPKKGKEMREFLKERSQDFYTKGRSLFHKEDKKVGLVKRIIIKALMPKKHTLSGIEEGEKEERDDNDSL